MACEQGIARRGKRIAFSEMSMPDDVVSQNVCIPTQQSFPKLLKPKRQYKGAFFLNLRHVNLSIQNDWPRNIAANVEEVNMG